MSWLVILKYKRFWRRSVKARIKNFRWRQHHQADGDDGNRGVLAEVKIYAHSICECVQIIGWKKNHTWWNVIEYFS